MNKRLSDASQLLHILGMQANRYVVNTVMLEYPILTIRNEENWPVDQ